MSLQPSKSSFSLKSIVAQKILTEVIRMKAGSGKHSRQPSDWRVLIVDELSVRMLSACLKMHELSEEKITIVETIEKRRKPLPNMEAIYLLNPVLNSVRSLIDDFNGVPMYKCAHVYFTEVCGESLFEELKQSQAAKKIKTLMEISLSFLPTERQVFSLDTPSALSIFYSNTPNPNQSAILDRMAEQLATLCFSLGEYPSIRYRAENTHNSVFAELVRQKLDILKSEDSTMGEGSGKSQSLLIILDRGFDPLSPLLHELTFQAMVYDLLNITNDVFRFESDPGVFRESILDESDELWADIRHKHIAEVISTVNEKFKSIKDVKRSSNNALSTKELSLIIKKMPQHQKELSNISTHIQLAGECMKIYEDQINKLCMAEQELATGATAEGEKVKDPMKNLTPLLLDTKISLQDKIRLILIFAQTKNDISTDHLDKLLNHAQLPIEERTTLHNFLKLQDGRISKDKRGKWLWKSIPKRDRTNERTFQTSRWTPVLKDILEDAIDGKLNSNLFPFCKEQKQNGGPKMGGPSSNRFGNWHSENVGDSARKNLPRLIIYIMGGYTYSETRAGYEVANSKTNWEVVVGGSHLITPKTFLNNLKHLENLY